MIEFKRWAQSRQPLIVWLQIHLLQATLHLSRAHCNKYVCVYKYRNKRAARKSKRKPVLVCTARIDVSIHKDFYFTYYRHTHTHSIALYRGTVYIICSFPCSHTLASTNDQRSGAVHAHTFYWIHCCVCVCVLLISINSETQTSQTHTQKRVWCDTFNFFKKSNSDFLALYTTHILLLLFE
jgi:hypothetical protein